MIVSTRFLLDINTRAIAVGWQRILRLVKCMTPACMQCRELMLIVIVLIGWPFTLAVICRHGLGLHGGCELALLTQPLSEDVEAYRYRNHCSSETSKKCTCPLNTKVVEHLARKERKAGADDGSQEGVGCNGRRRAGTVSNERNQEG